MFVFFVVVTLAQLNPDMPRIVNNADQDQLASEEANWSGSALFTIQYVNLYQPGSSSIGSFLISPQKHML